MAHPRSFSERAGQTLRALMGQKSERLRLQGNPIPPALSKTITAKEEAEIRRLQDKAIAVDTESNARKFKQRRHEILEKVRDRKSQPTSADKKKRGK